MYSFPNEQKYKDYVCILSVLAQVSIDNAKRSFNVDLISEIDRITKDMDVKNIGYPIFWKGVKDKKAKIGDKKFDMAKVNKELVCPMNYLYNYRFPKFRNKESTLPMSYFFQKFELEEDRRKSARMEQLIADYSLEMFQTTFVRDNNEFSDWGNNEDWILLNWDFEELIDSLTQTYISSTYIGVMSWLIDRAFMISPSLQRNKDNLNSLTPHNKSLLIKVLHDINAKNVIKIFSKNIS